MAPWHHNGTILITYEARTKQLKRKETLDQTTTLHATFSTQGLVITTIRQPVN